MSKKSKKKKKALKPEEITQQGTILLLNRTEEQDKNPDDGYLMYHVDTNNGLSFSPETLKPEIKVRPGSHSVIYPQIEKDVRPFGGVLVFLPHSDKKETTVHPRPRSSKDVRHWTYGKLATDVKRWEKLLEEQKPSKTQKTESQIHETLARTESTEAEKQIQPNLADESEVFAERQEERQQQAELEEQKPRHHLRDAEENHLIAQLLQAKASRNFITYVSLFCALLGEYFLYTQTQKISFVWVMALTVALLLGNLVNQRILKYRVAHGLYGTCYSEAKEIVSFILEWHRKNGNSNGKPPKLVFTQEELDECLQVNGGEEYAG